MLRQVYNWENAPLMKKIVEALQEECGPEEFVIYRQPFRWLRYKGDFFDGHVLNNCYEMFSLETVLEEYGLQCRYGFTHAAIVSPLTPPGEQP